jgi:signal transduction histidine kinase/ActR/RegA family two-component response regulator
MQSAGDQNARGISLKNPFIGAVIAFGVGVLLFSAWHLQVERLDARFLIILIITLVFSSRLVVRIPTIPSQISVSDTLIFLTLLLYGREAAVLLSILEASVSSPRFSKRAVTTLFNAAVMGISTFLTASALGRLFGPPEQIIYVSYSANLIFALGVMALVQYITNSGLVAVASALRTGQAIWSTWRNYYLWTSVTYLAGASAAIIVAKLTLLWGFYSVLATTPIILVVYLTYRTYAQNLEAARRHVEELSRYIAEQEKLRAQCAQLEKLSALGELASGVAHDFNNILSGILGRAQLLLRTDDAETIRHGLAIIVKMAEDGAKTVKRIQDFARQRRHHERKPVSVDQILWDAFEITRPRWKDDAEAKGAHIQFDLEPRSFATVLGDESELREVLINMIFNAVDALPHGGRIRLASETLGEEVIISLSDTGIGIGPEIISRIFDPFFTTKEHSGLGLGLAISYSIIQRHGGRITVESEPGRGTTFRISLPIARFSAQTAGPEAVARASAEKAHILVVDDEDYVRELLCDILSSEGHMVTQAESARRALELFERYRFDAVFTDIGMPEMNGWELARRVRAIDDEIPIALITGWGEMIGEEEREKEGIDWVVAKPFQVDQILDLASQALERRAKDTQIVG